MSHSTMSEVIAATFEDEPPADTSTATQRLAKTPNRSETSKAEIVLKKLRLARGVTVAQIMELTGWQSHSVRGFLSAIVRKKLKLNLVHERSILPGSASLRGLHPQVDRGRARPGVQLARCTARGL